MACTAPEAVRNCTGLSRASLRHFTDSARHIPHLLSLLLSLLLLLFFSSFTLPPLPLLLLLVSPPPSPSPAWGWRLVGAMAPSQAGPALEP